MNVNEIVQQIQYMVAPAVMVSSSALLLLGFHNKFATLANRFRVLNHEKRLLQQKSQRDNLEDIRLKNLIEQVGHFMTRATYVKNAILFTYAAIICFISTSILIFFAAAGSAGFRFLSTTVFFFGFLALIVTSIFMVLETLLFYRIIVLEKQH